jgi:mRNA-degrading endonuclease toxin of MazEF toxin-antitoxin module
VIERGQIYWCGLDPVQGHEQRKTRPVVIISSDSYNKSRSPLTAIVPLTSSPAKNPIHLSLSPADTGLDSASTALIDHARFIDRSRLKGEPIGRVQPVAMALLNRQLTRVFGL